eukprot:2474931-Prymnesium_polylepis.1
MRSNDGLHHRHTRAHNYDHYEINKARKMLRGPPKMRLSARAENISAPQLISARLGRKALQVNATRVMT